MTDIWLQVIYPCGHFTLAAMQDQQNNGMQNCRQNDGLEMQDAP